MILLVDWRHRSFVVALSATLTPLLAGCSEKAPTDVVDGGVGGAARDASLGGAGGAGAGGIGGRGGITGATGGIGGGIIPPLPPGGNVIDVGRIDGMCPEQCSFPGGQLCGRIGSNCGGGFVDCGSCTETGFSCGGSGLTNVCGATRDSGACKPVVCDPPGGQYCGAIGGGCGDMLDCGLCRLPFTCGGGGVANVCGLPDGGDCMPAVCNGASHTFCGWIGDGCGKSLDCGACPAGRRCTDNVCGAPCSLCTQIALCDGAVATTVSGTAVTAAQTNPTPLSGALVFIPNLAAGAKLPPLADGPVCSQCATPSSDTVVAFAIAGPDGRFVLRDVPSGNGIPIVVQLGSWRRQTTIDVLPCVDNALPVGTLRLPRNQSEGDIPLTAVSTGNHDTIECLLRKIGIDDAEFTHPSGSGRIHLYHSNGAVIDAATPDELVLTGTVSGGGSWRRYSQVLLPCEGAEMLETPEGLGNFTDYVDRGGRVLATHFSYVWFFRNGAWANIGTWTPGSADPRSPLATDVVTSSATGADFAKWLGAVGALSRPAPPQISITAPHADLGTVAAGSAKLWLSSFSPATSQAVSIEAPILSPPDKNCGRLTFSDFHASVTAPRSTTFPGECDPDLTLTAEEKALAFMLFDSTSCTGPKVAQPPLRPAPPPPVPPPPRPPRPPPPPIPEVVAPLRIIERR